jgi:hypothetical protein
MLWTYQVVELDGSDAMVHARDDLLGDGRSVNVVRVQPVTEPRDTSSDLVELDAFLAAVALEDEHCGRRVVAKMGKKETGDGDRAELELIAITQKAARV